VPNGFPPGIGYTSVQQWLAIYRALQDARGAIRSILKMQLDGVNSNLYQIDVDKIFLGGMSAGSVLALSVEYFGGQSKIDQVFPGISSLLGSIDLSGVYYADPPATIGDDYFGKIEGILDCWGSLLTPVAYVNNPYSFFAEQGYSLPPIIAFHGMKDETFNYKRQGIYFSPTDYQNGYGDLFRIESRCLPSSFNINPTNDGQNADFVCIGSQIIYQMLRNNSIFTELYLDCQMAHGLDDDCGGCPADPSNLSKDKQCDTCSYQSDFGTGSINSDQTLDYIAGRAATFFQAILGGISTSLVANGNVSKFTECENKRVECNTTDAGGCRDEDVCPLSE
jgi:hypothetical protein